MRGQNRKVYPDIINHCYQRTINGNLLFYNDYDHLTFFTILCVTADKYPGIHVFKVCQMPDHLHQSSAASSKKELSAFTQNYTSVFAKEHNHICYEKGNVFRSPFGSVPKYGDKNARSNLIYVDNNPVERHLVDKAEEYRWNYLAYANSNHPFSEPLIVRYASREMVQAINIVKSRHKCGLYLPYAMIKKMFAPLNSKERKQLTDYIITTYNVLDYAGAIRFFGSYEDMLLADHSVTGSEHSINEVFVGRSDIYYEQMTTHIMSTGRFTDIHDIFRLSFDEKMNLMRFLNQKTDAPLEQIAKYLHIPFSISA